MKSLSRAAAAALIALAVASPCRAGQVKLEIHDGLVTLSAKDASVREVLAEWARVGQTRVVNGERVPSGLLTLELTSVPEAKALDIVLRSVAGYVAAPRAEQKPTLSRFDRILVMAVPRPASSGGSPTATATPAAPLRPDSMRTYQPQPSLMVDDQDEPVVQPTPQPMPVPPSSAAGYPGAAQPGVLTPAPAGTQYPYPQGQPLQQPNVPGAATSPAAPRPGMATPPGKPPGGPGGQ